MKFSSLLYNQQRSLKSIPLHCILAVATSFR